MSIAFIKAPLQLNKSIVAPAVTNLSHVILSLKTEIQGVSKDLGIVRMSEVLDHFPNT
jgi:hypothetical protein